MSALAKTTAAIVVAVAGILGSAVGPVLAEQPAPEESTARYEFDFLTGMVDHHAMAVETAEMCVEKAIHGELRTLCQEIIEAQTAEIATMQSWLEEWYGVTYEPSMSSGDMQRMERMARMDAEDFEVAFMEMMTRHHRTAIREASGCMEHASHAALVELCQRIIETQSEEITVMQEWLCDWYDRCRGHAA